MTENADTHRIILYVHITVIVYKNSASLQLSPVCCAVERRPAVKILSIDVAGSLQKGAVTGIVSMLIVFIDFTSSDVIEGSVSITAYEGKITVQS